MGTARAERRAAQALERVGAKACIGRRWGELSNWQRVLVGLARALPAARRWWSSTIYSTARGTGDEEAADLLRTLVEESEPRCGVLMSTSDMESAMFADRVCSLTRKGG